jgi:hypothetical protein
VTQAIQEIEKLFRRDLTLTLPNGVHLGPGIKIGGLNEPEARGIANSIVGGAASHAANYGVTHLIQGIENLFNRRDTDFSKLYDEIFNLGPENPVKSFEARGLGGDIAKSAASGAANAGFTQIIQALEGLFRRDLDSLETPQGHGPKVLSQPLRPLEIDQLLQARDVNSNVAINGVVGTFPVDPTLNQIIQGFESVFRRDSTLEPIIGHGPEVSTTPSEIEQLLEKFNAVEARGLGSSIAKSAASGAANAGLTQLIQGLESFFRRDSSQEQELESKFGLPPSVIAELLQGVQARGIGSDIAKSAASGAANAGVTQIIQGLESLFRRDVDLD